MIRELGPLRMDVAIFLKDVTIFLKYVQNLISRVGYGRKSLPNVPQTRFTLEKCMYFLFFKNVYILMKNVHIFLKVVHGVQNWI